MSQFFLNVFLVIIRMEDLVTEDELSDMHSIFDVISPMDTFLKTLRLFNMHLGKLGYFVNSEALLALLPCSLLCFKMQQNVATRTPYLNLKAPLELFPFLFFYYSHFPSNQPWIGFPLTSTF
ncbi:hypothetical protein ILYODFUR_030510 [Ilyodon furcidens]|uniref:Uncharacterized protein n=1 Tax=Ilyodon furcidens TaxID=33524 RepID=A0ABV0VIH2_9TELE